MKAKDKPVIIWTPEGSWFQQAVNGTTRSSFLGQIGPPEQVKEWCEANTLDFAQKFHAFRGTAVRERWPDSPRQAKE